MANPYIPSPPAPIPPQYSSGNKTADNHASPAGNNGFSQPSPPSSYPYSGNGQDHLAPPSIYTTPVQAPPPPPYPTNGYAYYTQPAYYQAPQKGQGQAIAALVLGIVAVVCCLYFYLSLPCAIIGLALGIVSKRKGNGGMATAGIALSSVGLGISLLFLILVIIAFVIALSETSGGSSSYYYDGYQQTTQILSRTWFWLSSKI